MAILNIIDVIHFAASSSFAQRYYAAATAFAYFRLAPLSALQPPSVFAS